MNKNIESCLARLGHMPQIRQQLRAYIAELEARTPAELPLCPTGSSEYNLGRVEGWNQCRAALLQGGTPAAPVVTESSPVKVAGLGRIWNEDNGFLELQFKDEDAAQAFMQNYEPTVDVRDMPDVAGSPVDPYRACLTVACSFDHDSRERHAAMLCVRAVQAAVAGSPEPMPASTEFETWAKSRGHVLAINPDTNDYQSGTTRAARDAWVAKPMPASEAPYCTKCGYFKEMHGTSSADCPTGAGTKYTPTAACAMQPSPTTANRRGTSPPARWGMLSSTYPKMIGCRNGEIPPANLSRNGTKAANLLQPSLP